MNGGAILGKAGGYLLCVCITNMFRSKQDKAYSFVFAYESTFRWRKGKENLNKKQVY